MVGGKFSKACWELGWKQNANEKIKKLKILCRLILPQVDFKNIAIFTTSQKQIRRIIFDCNLQTQHWKIIDYVLTSNIRRHSLCGNHLNALQPVCCTSACQLPIKPTSVLGRRVLMLLFVNHRYMVKTCTWQLVKLDYGLCFPINLNQMVSCWIRIRCLWRFSQLIRTKHFGKFLTKSVCLTCTWEPDQSENPLSFTKNKIVSSLGKRWFYDRNGSW